MALYYVYVLLLKNNKSYFSMLQGFPLYFNFCIRDVPSSCWDRQFVFWKIYPILITQTECHSTETTLGFDNNLTLDTRTAASLGYSYNRTVASL